MRESRTRAAALFLSDLFYGSGSMLDRARRFCRINVGSGKRRQKYFLKRFAEALLLCRAIVTPIRKLALYILIYRVSTSCVKFFFFDRSSLYVYIYSLSVYFFILFYFSTALRWNTMSVIFFYPSTRKKLFSALAANEVEKFAGIVFSR